MVNIKSEVKGDSLILTIDLTERNGKSSSGKTTIVASTGGNAKVGGTGPHKDIQYGLNVFVKP